MAGRYGMSFAAKFIEAGKYEEAVVLREDDVLAVIE